MCLVVLEAYWSDHFSGNRKGSLSAISGIEERIIYYYLQLIS